LTSYWPLAIYKSNILHISAKVKKSFCTKSKKKKEEKKKRKEKKEEKKKRKEKKEEGFSLGAREEV
jgi:hypothetical protein